MRPQVWPEGAVLNALAVEGSSQMQGLGSRLERARREAAGGGPRVSWVRDLPAINKAATGQRRRWGGRQCDGAGLGWATRPGPAGRPMDGCRAANSPACRLLLACVLAWASPAWQWCWPRPPVYSLKVVVV